MFGSRELEAKKHTTFDEKCTMFSMKYVAFSMKYSTFRSKKTKFEKNIIFDFTCTIFLEYRFIFIKKSQTKCGLGLHFKIEKGDYFL